MVAPKLTNSEFNRLLPLVLPPRCEVSNLIIAAQKRSLTGCQLATLLLATAISLRFYTDKYFHAKIMVEELYKDTSEHGWGYKGRSFYK